MTVEFKYLTYADEKLLKEIQNSDVLFMDTETTGLCPIQDKLRLIQIKTLSDIWLIDCFKVEKDFIKQVLNLCKNKLCVFHNAVFDISFIKNSYNIYLENLYDTLAAASLLSFGIKTKLSLKEVVKRFLNIELDKEQQLSDWSADNLSNEQLRYSAEDVNILSKLYPCLDNYIKKFNLVNALQLENSVILPLVMMKLSGIGFDYDKWASVSDETQKNLEAVRSALFEKIGFEINLNSPKQLKDYLNSIGIKVESTDKKTLNLITDSDIGKQILEYKRLAKELNAFGKDWIKYVNPVTKRIHTNFSHGVVKTGRFSSYNPNLQQVPHEKKFRQCFIPAKGFKFIVADYSQIEIRMLAEMSKDKTLVKALNSGGDLHRFTASLIYNKPENEIDDALRYVSKQLNFSIVYGIGPKNFSLNSNIPLNDSIKIIDKYHKIFEGVSIFISSKSREAVANRFCKTKLGRILSVEGDPNNYADFGAMSRFGVNAPIQGSCAEILKLAMVYLFDELKNSEGKLVHSVHDELLIEVPDDSVKQYSDVLFSVMKEAAEQFIKTVPVEIDLEVADTWL